jgi:1-deoxy-D-xylulose-5-phosphate reductoisomerase
MNKGLEAIEAKWLFGMDIGAIDVHIHPQSIIHSMVEYIDGSVVAQLGIPDMRIPIAYALSYPERLPLDLPALDLFQVGALSFERPDTDKFPCLRLALEAARAGGDMPVVLNAANEVAVNLFLQDRIGFMNIPALVEKAMELHTSRPIESIDHVIEADAGTREIVMGLAKG